MLRLCFLCLMNWNLLGGVKCYVRSVSLSLENQEKMTQYRYNALVVFSMSDELKFDGRCQVLYQQCLNQLETQERLKRVTQQWYNSWVMFFFNELKPDGVNHCIY